MGKFSRDWKDAQRNAAQVKAAARTAEGKRLNKALDEAAGIVSDVDKLVARYGETPTAAMVKSIGVLATRFRTVSSSLPTLQKAAGVSAVWYPDVESLQKTLSAMANAWNEEWRPVPGGTRFKPAGPWTRDWQEAKTVFESKTSRKKPSRTILGAFRLSSGIEKALSTCEVLALKLANDPDGKTSAKLAAACADMRRATSSYVGDLRRAQSADGGADPVYGEQLAVLAKALERIADSLQTACEAAEEKWRAAPYDLKRCAAAFATAQGAVRTAESKVGQALKGSDPIDAKTFQKHLTDPTKTVATALLALQKLAVGREAPRSVLSLPLQQVQIYGKHSHRDAAKGQAGADPVRALLETAADFYDSLGKQLDKALRDWQQTLSQAGRRLP